MRIGVEQQRAGLQFDQFLSEASRVRLRRGLTGLWIASILGVLGVAVHMTVFGGVDVPQIREDRTFADYLIPTGLSFMSQYVDATLGMGYGTTLTALLVLLGFPVRQVVFAVLLQQLAAGGVASLFHHIFGNADLRPGRFHFRLALLLGGVAIIGSFLAATLAASMTEIAVDTALGGVIIAMGIVIFVARRIHLRFSWWRAGLLGLIAGANKGFMGGGYGPMVVAGQTVVGDSMRHAVAVTALSESLSCVGGVAGYLVMGVPMPWLLTGALLVGGIFASVFAAATIRSLPQGALKSVVGAMYLILGGLTLWEALV
ncbi:MAG: sulfite exporter TauE/SafE family protein [Armatimonadota bacterium]